MQIIEILCLPYINNIDIYIYVFCIDRYICMSLLLNNNKNEEKETK